MPDFIAPKKRKKPDSRGLKSEQEKLKKDQQDARKIPPKQKKNGYHSGKKKDQIPVSPARQAANSQRRGRTPAKKKRGSRIIYYIIFIIITVAIFSILSVTVLFNAGEIVVEGECYYSSEEIIYASGLSGNENLVRLNTTEPRENILKKLVYIDDVEVVRSFPAKIVLKVKKATPIANIYDGSDYFIISERGKILEKAKVKSDCITFLGYHPKSAEVGEHIESAEEQKTNLIYEIMEAINKSEISDIRSVDIEDRLNISMDYKGKIQIVIGNSSHIHDKLSISKNLIETEINTDGKYALIVTNIEKVTLRPIYDETVPPITTVPITSEEEQTNAP